jgi:hypothetical protein
MSKNSENSRPNPKVPDAAMTGFFNAMPHSFVSSIKTTSDASNTGPSLQMHFIPALVFWLHPRQAPMPQAMCRSRER